MIFRSATFKSGRFWYALMVSPKRIGSFWEVSVAMRWGESGMNTLGSRTVTTVSMNTFGFSTPGSTTTGRPSW